MTLKLTPQVVHVKKFCKSKADAKGTWCINLFPSHLHSPIYFFFCMRVAVKANQAMDASHRTGIMCLLCIKDIYQVTGHLVRSKLVLPQPPLPSRLIQFFSFLKSSTLRISLIRSVHLSVLSSGNCSIGPSILTISHYVGALVCQLVNHISLFK